MADDGKEMAEGGGDASAAGSSDDKKEGEVAATAPSAAAGHFNTKFNYLCHQILARKSMD